MSDDEPPPPLDDKTIDDPTAWGFCDYCAFMVALVDGKLIEHPRYRVYSGDKTLCNGSGIDPVESIPYCATPRQRISLHKLPGRTQSRARYQRQRTLYRKKLRSLAPARMTITSLSTGEEVDITTSISGPVVLSMEAGDGRDPEE